MEDALESAEHQENATFGFGYKSFWKTKLILMKTIQLLLQLTQNFLWEVSIVINTLFSKKKKHNKEDFQNELYLESRVPAEFHYGDRSVFQKNVKAKSVWNF